MSHRLLVLAEGDPETLDSWSGSSVHLIDALRRRGNEVAGRDIAERGLVRALAIASAWVPSRRRWAARYHFGGVSFAARSARARAELRAFAEPWHGLFQIGATFDITGAAPTFIYCDSNARVAEANRPYGDVALLTPSELNGMVARERRVYQGAAHIFTMSELVRSSMIRDFGVPGERVTTVYSGANLDATACRPRTLSPGAAPTILFVGRFWESKGGPQVLEAFQLARQQVPDLRLRVVGCTPPIGEAPGVEVVGRIDKSAPGGVERMLSMYREADLFCMPSRFDAFGIVFVEAMLHGVACIGARHAAMPEIIAEGDTGWCVPIGDAGMLRDRFVEAFADRGVLARMGQRGRDRALKLFTWDAVTERMQRVVNAALAGPSR